MPNTLVTLELPEGEVAEAKEAGLTFIGQPLTSTKTGKEILAEVANEVIRKFRNETKGHSKGLIT